MKEIIFEIVDRQGLCSRVRTNKRDAIALVKGLDAFYPNCAPHKVIKVTSVTTTTREQVYP